MNSDPVELDLVAAARTRRRRFARTRPAAPTAAEPIQRMTLTVDLLDEAFALLADGVATRADAPTETDPAEEDLPSAACAALTGQAPASSARDASPQLSTPRQRIWRQRQLVDNLSAQLDTLDRQRGHLAQLLQDIDAGTAADLADA